MREHSISLWSYLNQVEILSQQINCLYFPNKVSFKEKIFLSKLNLNCLECNLAKCGSHVHHPVGGIFPALGPDQGCPHEHRGEEENDRDHLEEQGGPGEGHEAQEAGVPAPGGGCQSRGPHQGQCSGGGAGISSGGNSKCELISYK